MAKKRSKKKVTKKAPAKKSASLPQAAGIPEGMKQMGGGYAPTWKPEEIGDSLHGVVSALPKELSLKQGRKTNVTRVMEITDMEDKRHALWESAVLASLFDEIAAAGEDGMGVEVYIQYDGLGKKKAGQNATKLFTVAMAE